MNIKKKPLSDRLERLRNGQTAHEEYTGSVISDIANTPIASYMASFAIGWDPLREWLRSVSDTPEELTYMQVAGCIASWYKSEDKKDIALEAMKLLEAPLLAAHDRFKPPKKEE